MAPARPPTSAGLHQEAEDRVGAGNDAAGASSGEGPGASRVAGEVNSLVGIAGPNLASPMGKDDPTAARRDDSGPGMPTNGPSSSDHRQ